MKTKESTKQEEIGQKDYCSDYDEDCKKIDNPGKCFMGGISVCSNGVKAYAPMADGICGEMENR